MEPDETPETAPPSQPITRNRIVDFYEGGEGAEPKTAIVVYVHAENLVNLTVFDPATGTASGRTSVYYGKVNAPAGGSYCELPQRS